LVMIQREVRDWLLFLVALVILLLFIYAFYEVVVKNANVSFWGLI